MKNYREQNCCNNCEYTFEYFDCEEETRYYCNHRAPKRPKSGSIAMDESVYLENLSYKEEMKAWKKQEKAWLKWSGKREVESYGLCDNHNIKEKE